MNFTPNARIFEINICQRFRLRIWDCIQATYTTHTISLRVGQVHYPRIDTAQCISVQLRNKRKHSLLALERKLNRHAILRHVRTASLPSPEFSPVLLNPPCTLSPVPLYHLHAIHLLFYPSSYPPMASMSPHLKHCFSLPLRHHELHFGPFAGHDGLT